MNEVITQPQHSMLGALAGQDLPIGIMAILDEGLGAKLDKAANRMAKAVGMVPPHLIGNPVTCYAVLTRALTWRLDPFAVAQSTYTVPGGKIAYEGKLVMAILENSGRLDGGLEFEHFGDWSKVEGKFKKEKSQKGNDYFVPAYTDADEQGVGVIVRGKVKGEPKARAVTVTLRSCQPRNSTLWALRPKQQICYAAARVFANVAAPSLFMGVPFSTDNAGEMIIDITPDPNATRPIREAFEAATQTLDETAASADNEAPADEDNAADEFSVADAYAMGQKAFTDGKALRAVPPEWRDNPATQKFAEAWQEGWRAQEADGKQS